MPEQPSALPPERIEAILRDHQMHEPGCPVRQAQRHIALGHDGARACFCDCWLSHNAPYDHARCGPSGGCAAPVADFDPVNCPAENAPLRHDGETS